METVFNATVHNYLYLVSYHWLTNIWISAITVYRSFLLLLLFYNFYGIRCDFYTLRILSNVNYRYDYELIVIKNNQLWLTNKLYSFVNELTMLTDQEKMTAYQDKLRPMY